MVDVSLNARNQLADLISRFCDYRTPQEYGRSAFWIWVDKIKSETLNVTVKSAKNISAGQYCLTMKYWGKIFFTMRRLRIKNRFAGVVLTVTEYQFDNENFHRWLSHQAPIECKKPLSNIPNRKCKPIPIGFGFTKVKAKSGLFTIADGKGEPLDAQQWFKDIAHMRKTRKGEIAALVNIGGTGYAFYPQREKGHKLETTNKSWHELCSESRNGAMTIAESDLRMMVRECINRLLNESEYYKYGEKERAYVESFGHESKIGNAATINEL